ncbi:MAG: anion permease [Clostridiales bacterium]|nr:anion permease [Clostridiales bacterium]
MNTQLVITLVVLVLMIAGFLCGKFRLGLVAMTAATVLCLTGVLTFNEAYANFSNNNVVMIGGMFILSGALSKTSLVPNMRRLLMRHSEKSQLIVFVYMLACAVLIQFSMPTALISMLLPFMAAFNDSSRVQPSHLLFPGAVLAHCCQGILPGAYFVMINGLLEANGSPVMIGALDYSKVILLPALLAFAYIVLIGWKGLPGTSINTASLQTGKEKNTTLTPFQEKAVYVIFTLNFLGILFQQYLPFEMYVLPVAAVIILCYLKALDLKDIGAFINLDTIFMLAGVMPLGTAMQKTGAGAIVSDFIMGLLGGNPSPMLMLFAFYFAGAILTQFMSNTATQQVFVPLAIVTALSQGLDPRPFTMAIFAGCTAAMLTPTGSPSIAISFGAGQYRIKDILKVFLPLWLLYGIFVCLAADFFFPLG